MTLEELQKYDYRENILVDKDNPVLVWKAWRDHYSGGGCHSGKAYLSVSYSEDALTWNVFRSLQKAGETGLEIISNVFKISKVKTILFWGCDVENHGEEQQLLNILIRTIDGKYKGTMTEPDLVIITEDEVIFVECKLNSGTWTASGEGWKKRYQTYIEEFPELKSIEDTDRKNLYQIIRQYVYARKLGEYVGKNPLVTPLVNKCHVDKFLPYYSIFKKYNEINKDIFRNFVTWQDISETILKSCSLDYYKGILSTKINYTLDHVSK